MIVRHEWFDRTRGGVNVESLDDNVTWVRQVHGPAVVVVSNPGDQRGVEADALVTNVADCRLLIRTADCAPVLLVGRSESCSVIGIGVAHAGWRGLLAGVLPATVDALRSLGASTCTAQLFPTIGASCYEFGAEDLASLTAAFGDEVRAHSSSGGLALDMVAAVRSSLRRSGVADLDVSQWRCTACDSEGSYSFRARADSSRMGIMAWLTNE